MLLDKGVDESKILFLTVIAAPEGIRRICGAYPRLRVLTSEIDEGMDDLHIVPGGARGRGLLACALGCLECGGDADGCRVGACCGMRVSGGSRHSCQRLLPAHSNLQVWASGEIATSVAEKEQRLLLLTAASLWPGGAPLGRALPQSGADCPSPAVAPCPHPLLLLPIVIPSHPLPLCNHVGALRLSMHTAEGVGIDSALLPLLLPAAAAVAARQAGQCEHTRPFAN